MFDILSGKGGNMKIGIRREDKSIWERRTPLTPGDLSDLAGQGRTVAVESSGHRVFSDADFAAAGVPVQPDIRDCGLILGIKEIPLSAFQPGTVHLFFSHVVKGQPFNMPMLRRMMERRVTLFDYERIVDENGRRLIFFGRHAGLAGMVNTLWALGRRLRGEGVSSPLDGLRQMREYADLEEALAAMAALKRSLRTAGVPAEVHPLLIGRVGGGNAGRGADEILAAAGAETAEIGDIATLAQRPADRIYRLPIRKSDWIEPRNSSQSWDEADYLRHGTDRYKGDFLPLARHLSALVNCMYWDRRYPRLLTRTDFQTLYSGENPPRLRVIGDIGCDVNGPLACTVRATDPGTPVYTYDPAAEEARDGVCGPGPAVMAVYMLPAEIPRESSIYFSGALKPFIPALAAADYSRPAGELALPPELRRAMILHRGELTPAYEYLRESVG
jgi:alpha-aminoadipic semialdehyde synthase